MTEDLVRMVLDAYSKIAEKIVEGKEEEGEKILKELVENIENSATFKAIYERLLRLPKDFLAYLLAHVFILIPDSIDALEAIEIGDTDTLDEIAKKTLNFIEDFFGG